MKRSLIGGSLAVVVLAGAAHYVFRPANVKQSEPQGAPESVEGRALSVDDVAANPELYKQRIAVRGIVYFVSAKDQVAALISEAEFATCGTACPSVVLPVRWRGELPTVTDRVVVQGGIEATQRGFVFNASDVEIVERGRSDGR